MLRSTEVGHASRTARISELNSDACDAGTPCCLRSPVKYSAEIEAHSDR